ncbi:class I adenylate-forming enzyme family protein [Actinospongicola halichondriae]|uniref:class I adenylate-forming enzyme family protein n=1 Tax=Actinospongicola halichondriae TaxID=3236844 RepID=UPI003D4302E4
MLPGVVSEAARRFGEVAAFVAPDGTTTTYEELDQAAGRVAAGMAQRGLGEGDVVALRMRSDIDYVLAYLAAARIGAITAGINPKLAVAEQDAMVAMVSPALTVHGHDDVQALRDSDAPTPEPVHPDPGRDVAIVFTSGTTGLPKGAVFTEKQLAAVTEIDVQSRWGGGGHMIAATQFAHVGFMTKLPWYLRLGSTIHMLDKWNAGDVLRLVDEHRIASIGGVAPQVALMVRAPEARTLDFTCVQSIIMGGGASSPALVAEARDVFGAPYSIRYSSTECGGCGTGTAFDADDEEALHTVGRPRAGVELSIRADGEELPHGEIGEVCLRSDAVMDRYWDDEETTATTIRDRWLHSGDLGFIDDRGLLRLAGRSKEMYIRGGYNVYPMEVESALADHPAIVDVAVVAAPDDVLGERGVAHVVAADPSAPPTLDDLRSHLRDRIATYKFPEAIHLVDELPLTPMQKIDRRSLAAVPVDFS